MRFATGILLLWGTMFFVFAAASAAGEQEARKPAVTDIKFVDADYAFQGEYVGSRRDQPTGVWCRTGLQVIARGSGRFEAVLYRGGLPGAGWDGQTKTKLSGELAAGALVLRDEAQTITCDGTAVLVHDGRGAEVGRLEKMQRVSPTLGASPPPGAIILFDGTSTAEFEDARLSDEGLLEVGPVTKRAYGDFRMHLEFRLPYMPYATGQGRANSGVYIQRRYEVQVLDSFGLDGAFNECGALYRQQPPGCNMCFPPLTWQTYDIWFTASRWDAEGNKCAGARITLWHNGVPVHCDYEITNKTGAGKPEGPERLPILLQNHGNPVVFRNIWIVEETPRYVAVSCERPARLRCVRFQRLFSRLRCQH
jgi:hypothetical protein